MKKNNNRMSGKLPTLLQWMAPKSVRCAFLMIKERVFVDFGADLYFPENITIGKGSIVRRVSFTAGKSAHITIGKNCYFHDHVYLNCHGDNITIGDDCSFNNFDYIDGHGNVDIGSNCAFGPHLSVVSNHTREKDGSFGGATKAGVVIGNNCWIGACVTIVDGATVGEDCVIAANSVVTQSIPKNSMAAGAPAKVIKTI
jgi:acetyltransferase-like isoleucine patch superfamily enzyme